MARPPQGRTSTIRPVDPSGHSCPHAGHLNIVGFLSSMTLTACRHFGQTRHRHREHVSRSYRFGGALYPLRRAGGPELSEGCVTIRPVDWSKVNTPAAPRPDPPAPTLIRTVWVMTRPPNKRVTAGIYQTRFG